MFKIFNLILITVTFLCPTISLADNQTLLYTGTIGNAPIVMQFTVDAEKQVEGKYFYRKHHVDIDIIGQQSKDGKISLGENLRGDDHRVDLILQPLSKDTLQGQWIGKKRQAPVPIKLTKVDPDALPNNADAQLNALKKNDVFNYLRLIDLPLKQGKRDKFQGHTLQWWREPVSGIQVFRVLDSYSATNLEYINQILAERQQQEVINYFECMSRGDEYNLTVTPHLMTEQLFSASVFASYSCGGAHPDFGDNPININVKAQRPLDLADVFWLGSGKPDFIKTIHDSLGPRKYQDEILAPWLLKTMQKLYKDEFSEDDDCSYNDVSVWSYPVWYPTSTGIYFGPTFPRVCRSQDMPEWSVLPWAVVNQHRGTLKLVTP